jgi:cytochrome c peroxidase
MMIKENKRTRGCLRWVGIGAGVIILLLCGVLTAFAFLPAEEDFVIPVREQGGGARQSASAVTGLQAAFPEIPPVDREQAELGRLLFYDPVLSASNTMSCASCHHPDQGFSDGRALAQGAHQQDLRRNAPSLWNVAFVDNLFWDGRSPSLEEQLLIPLTHADEMGADTGEMLAELGEIEEYIERFEAVYEDGITLDNIVASIVAFQRSLISRSSPFDRYAAGDFNALTSQQRRGFEIFRSAETRCFECHAFPTFSDNQFHVLGVPDNSADSPDRGRVEVLNAPDAEFGFRTPGLRNVVLTAPYMHNGVFATLEEVIDFYADGGGVKGGGVEVKVDEKVRGFTITEREKADLIAYLYSLTDEPSELIAIPDSVPSGLPVVQPLENPARDQVEISTAPPYTPGEAREPHTIIVKAGESIQAAVDRALPGDTIRVEPGIYYETVYIDIPQLTVQGVVNGDERPWLDGQNEMSDGFNTTGDDFVLEGFGIRNYIGNGVLTTNAERVVYRDLIVEGSDNPEFKTIYGLYPVECTDVLIENVTATRIADAAIYVGQSRGPIIVRNNTVYGNVTGIEIENSTNAEVYDNHVYNNSAGILVFLLPNNPSKVGYNTRVYNNLVEDNNHPNFAHEGAIVATVPPGTGMMIMTADNTEVFDNTIRNNRTVGIALTSLYIIYSRDTTFDLGPIPENNWIHSNTFENNGYEPAGLAAELGIPGADIMWTGEGWNNSFDQPGASTFPPILPGRDWPDPAKRALWRVYDLAIRALLG